jgi:hypothetical protein
VQEVVRVVSIQEVQQAFSTALTFCQDSYALLGVEQLPMIRQVQRMQDTLSRATAAAAQQTSIDKSFQRLPR